MARSREPAHRHRALADAGSGLEVQPAYGQTIVTAFARIGGQSVLIVANQPAVKGGTITADAAEKAAHFLRVAGSFGLPAVVLAHNPGVMPGPEAERERMDELQTGAWVAADTLGYDRVIDPRDLRNEVIHALRIRSAPGVQS